MNGLAYVWTEFRGLLCFVRSRQPRYKHFEVCEFPLKKLQQIFHFCLVILQISALSMIVVDVSSEECELFFIFSHWSTSPKLKSKVTTAWAEYFYALVFGNLYLNINPDPFNWCIYDVSFQLISLGIALFATHENYRGFVLNLIVSGFRDRKFSLWSNLVLCAEFILLPQVCRNSFGSLWNIANPRFEV